MEAAFARPASAVPFKGQAIKEHKTYIQVGKGYVRGQCTCKNGKWKCSHQSALLFQTLAEVRGIKIDEIFRLKKKRETI